MGNKLISPVRASVIAGWCGAVWQGDDVEVRSITPLSTPIDGALCFSNAAPNQALGASIALISTADAQPFSSCLLVTERPRLTFAKALNAIQQHVGFEKLAHPPKIDPTAQVSSQAFIDSGVVIGARSVILPFVYIGEGSIIGEDCIIKPGTIIGQDGFGFERDENGLPLRLLHLGNVIIGNNVEIGSVNTICRGTLGDTVVGNHVKTDDHVHVAHNVKIDSGALITACAELSGGVQVGEGAWIGPNASIIQKIKIGKKSLIGIGACVTKHIPDNVIAAGNPAKILRSND
jgi:UDP-3-O-[3-hydroxymyristoyl] glucosamine N-acyltransferase